LLAGWGYNYAVESIVIQRDLSISILIAPLYNNNLELGVRWRPAKPLWKQNPFDNQYQEGHHLFILFRVEALYKKTSMESKNPSDKLYQEGNHLFIH
jgi:hypothetical protein